MGKVYVSSAVVVGGRCSTFPVDMLRYDSCFPATGEDAGKVAASLDRVCARGPGDLQHIKLQKYGMREWGWTERRWENFGWRVEDIEPPRAV